MSDPRWFLHRSRHMQRYAPHVNAETLLQFREPISPHLAAIQDGPLPVEAQDTSIVQRLSTWLQTQTSTTHDSSMAVYVETAGGVHSPAPSGSSQADLLRPLRLPTVLIGSSALGGISTTRSAYESLVMRGYDIDAVLLFANERYQNDSYLTPYFAERGVRVFTLGTQPTGAPPSRDVDSRRDQQRMQAYYMDLVHGLPTSTSNMLDVVRHLRTQHAERLARLSTLGERAHAHVWWPFTQHARIPSKDVMAIDSAHGDFFATYAPSAPSKVTPVMDGSASWWTQVVGHGHPRLALAAAQAAGRYGHVLFPGAANEPAVQLAERLLGRTSHTIAPGRGWADRVFYSDDGSTAMEVALKMALQSTIRRYDPSAVTSAATRERTRRGREPGSLGGRPPRAYEVLGLQGSYHGDTIGAMDACEPSVFSDHVAWYRGRGYWIAPPTMRMHKGKVQIDVAPTDDWAWRPNTEGPLATLSSLAAAYDVEARLTTPLADTYRACLHATLERLVRVERRQFGALVLEPVVEGAGGMLFIDPLFQRCLVDVVRARSDLFALRDMPLSDATSSCKTDQGAGWRGLPVIYDEVFAGLYRLGFASASSVLGVTPDIACYAKILSGGLIPLSVTLASNAIFDTFHISDEKQHALLHGHSYTAHPVGCQVALETLEMLEDMQPQQPLGGSVWDADVVRQLSFARGIQGIMALGTVLKIELATDGASGYASDASAQLVQALRTHDIHVRPLGHVVYVMTSLTTPTSVRRRIESILTTQLLS